MRTIALVFLGLMLSGCHHNDHSNVDEILIRETEVSLWVGQTYIVKGEKNGTAESFWGQSGEGVVTLQIVSDTEANVTAIKPGKETVYLNMKGATGASVVFTVKPRE